MAKAKVDEVISTDLSKLISSVSRDIAKDFELATYKEGETQKYLSTGNPGINYAFCAKFDGGFPIGKISEVYGLNSVGKSLIAQQALVETQKQGGISILIDSEFAFNPEWFGVLGGNPETLIVYEPPHIDAVYGFIKKSVESIRAKNKDILVTVVYDSVAASPSKIEFEGAEHDMGKRAIAHGKGIRMLMGLCSTHNVTFIAINQLRKTFAMYGPDTDTVGGMAWKYACSLRVNMKKGKKIEVKTPAGEKVVGVNGSLVVEKNRLRSPFAKADFNIFFDQGIDPMSGLFDVLVAENVVTPRKNEEGGITKGWWTYKDINFQKTNFDSVLEKYPELLGGHALIKGHANTIVEDEGAVDTDDEDSSDADM